MLSIGVTPLIFRKEPLSFLLGLFLLIAIFFLQFADHLVVTEEIQDDKRELKAEMKACR